MSGAPRAGIFSGIVLAFVVLQPGAAPAQSVSFAGKQLKILIGADVQAIVDRLSQAPADVIARAQAIATAN